MCRSLWSTVITAAALLALLALLGLAGCDSSTGGSPSPPTTPPPAVGALPAENTPGFVLRSPAFRDGQPLPTDVTCEGQKRSPELQWSGAPARTKSFCLIVTDPDAPGGTFTHWLLFNLPAKTSHLAAGAGDVGLAGHNDFDAYGYGPPCPPSGMHHYRFTLYALGEDRLGPSAGQSRADLEAGIRGHILGQTTLTGTYAKK